MHISYQKIYQCMVEAYGCTFTEKQVFNHRYNLSIYGCDIDTFMLELIINMCMT